MSPSFELIGFSDRQKVCAAELLKEIFPQRIPGSDLSIRAQAGDAFAIRKEPSGAFSITYSRPSELYRGLTFLPEVLETGKNIAEKRRYSMLCYMADQSRNAVFNLPTAKRMIRYLSSMGFDSMMLYTEDTYALPGYPYFGQMRGRFSEKELKELDDYADRFGIELIPCIQTLAHLRTALRWPDFDGYKDSDDILLVGDDRTYKFVEVALRQWKSCFRSNRIHLGMDEAHLIACGEYLKRNGYRDPSAVMLEHLDRVVSICRELGYRPMIWSDMFFRMQFHGAYHVSEGTISPDVIARVPDGLELVYWDYYTNYEKRFAHMLDCHAQFRSRFLFAGGAWKWSGFGAHNSFSLAYGNLQLRLCEEHGVDQIILTSWGDDGGEASQFSTLATLLFYAERNYQETVDRKRLESRCRACFGTSYETLLAFDLPDSLPETLPETVRSPKNPSKYLLYNDPLERLFDSHLHRETAPGAFAANAEKLLAFSGDQAFGYALRTLGLLCRVLEKKCDLGWRLYTAYGQRDTETLRAIAEVELPEILADLDRFLDAFREQWYRENKSFGFSSQEIRLGGLAGRLRSVRERILKYLGNPSVPIEELETPPLPVNPGKDGEYLNFNDWKRTVSAGIL